MSSRLKQVAIKQGQISRDIKTCEIDSFNNIDNPFSDSSGLTLIKFIMDIKAQDGERFSTTMTLN